VVGWKPTLRQTNANLWYGDLLWDEFRGKMKLKGRAIYVTGELDGKGRQVEPVRWVSLESVVEL